MEQLGGPGVPADLNVKVPHVDHTAETISTASEAEVRLPGGLWES